MKKPQSTWRPPGGPRISGRIALFSRIWLVFSVAALLQPQFLRALPPEQNNGHHKLRVDNPAIATELQAAGAQLIEDYGGFQVFEVPVLLQRLKNLPATEVRDDYNLVHLNEGTLDTTRPEIKSLRKK